MTGYQVTTKVLSASTGLSLASDWLKWLLVWQSDLPILSPSYHSVLDQYWISSSPVLELLQSIRTQYLTDCKILYEFSRRDRGFRPIFASSREDEPRQQVAASNVARFVSLPSLPSSRVFVWRTQCVLFYLQRPCGRTRVISKLRRCAPTLVVVKKIPRYTPIMITSCVAVTPAGCFCHCYARRMLRG